MTDDDKGWTLVARFSNNDDKNWLKDTGLWWYDQQVAIGATTDPSSNTDMTSPAFWMVGFWCDSDDTVGWGDGSVMMIGGGS